MDAGQHSIVSLFAPRSIAVVGVSRDKTGVGSTIFQNIIRSGYPNPIFAVNPNAVQVFNRPSFPTLTAVPDIVDLAIIAVPEPIVASILEDAGKKGVRAVIVISSGFAEAGREGKKKQDEIVAIAKKFSISMLGPNCLGVIHPYHHINASFARTNPIAGPICLISQSGAMGAALLDIITPKNIGLSHFISIGNRADIDEMALISHVATDKCTKVIGLYVEELKNAHELIKLSRTLNIQDNPIPIVVLKAGKTKEGAAAVSSHTGSLAGDSALYSTLFEQANIVETSSTHEFINTLVCMANTPLPKGRNAAIITNAGGPGILATDTLVSQGVTVPAFSGHHNPWDLLGDAKAMAYKQAIEAAEHEPAIHSIFSIVTPQTITEIKETATVFANHKTIETKPHICAWMGDSVMNEGKTILTQASIPLSKYPEDAAMMLANLHKYAKRRSELLTQKSEDISNTPPVLAKMDTNDLMAFISSLGIPTLNYVYMLPQENAAPKIASLADLVAIKLISKDIVHKTDAGAVALSVPKLSVPEKIQEMIASVKTKIPQAVVDRILCMDMVDTTGMMECIVGFVKTPPLGTAVMVGIGGIWVEIMKDVAFRFAPLTLSDARMMISHLQAYPVLAGARGSAPFAIDALAKTIMTVSQVALAYPSLSQFEINPLLVSRTGVLALDARTITVG